jgi:hypothetical protein
VIDIWFHGVYIFNKFNPWFPNTNYSMQRKFSAKFFLEKRNSAKMFQPGSHKASAAGFQKHRKRPGLVIMCRIKKSETQEPQQQRSIVSRRGRRLILTIEIEEIEEVD